MKVALSQLNKMSGIFNKIQSVSAEIADNGSDLRWWTSRLNDRVNAPIQRKLFKNSGVDLMNKDWDNLIIADAARADLFEEAVDLSKFDEYHRIQSRASSTPEWSWVNFQGDYGDTVYVSGTPTPSRHIPGTFHDYVEVWQDCFDESIGTVKADAVEKRCREVYKKYPNKRFIFHFLQPHYPFVNDTQFRFNYWHNTSEFDYGDDNRAKDVWEGIRKGLADPDEVWPAYRENLEYVMNYIWNLTDEIEGKTVVHSDHGNVMGNWSWPFPVRIYGHPSGLRLSKLTTVPWAVIKNGRREIIPEQAGVNGNEVADIETKLEALGYV